MQVKPEAEVIEAKLRERLGQSDLLPTELAQSIAEELRENRREDAEDVGIVLRAWWVRHVPGNEFERAQFETATFALSRLAGAPK